MSTNIMGSLEIRSLFVTKTGEQLISGLSLKVPSGEICTLMGASGSGKSTILNWVIGALDPAFSVRGELWLNDQRRDLLPIEARHIGILFQDDLLFPHLSVGQNLAFALPEHARGKAARRSLVEQSLSDVGLAGFHDRDPATLSGGQRARISVLRTLLAEPEALLLDEPFSKLDAVLREQFRAFVFDRVSELGIPTLLVTHDPADIPPTGSVIEISTWQGGDA